MKLTDCGVMANLNQNLDTDNSCTFSQRQINLNNYQKQSLALSPCACRLVKHTL